MFKCFLTVAKCWSTDNDGTLFSRGYVADSNVEFEFILCFSLKKYTVQYKIQVQVLLENSITVWIMSLTVKFDKTRWPLY